MSYYLFSPLILYIYIYSEYSFKKVNEELYLNKIKLNSIVIFNLYVNHNIEKKTR